MQACPIPVPKTQWARDPPDSEKVSLLRRHEYESRTLQGWLEAPHPSLEILSSRRIFMGGEGGGRMKGPFRDSEISPLTWSNRQPQT